MRSTADQTWTKVLAIIAVAGILAGALVLRCSLFNASRKNWTPIQLPFPPPEIRVSAPFELVSGGKFELQIVTSATQAEQLALSREGPPFGISFTYEISGPGGFRVGRAVKQMELSSWSIDTDIYTAQPFVTLPQGGHYSIVVRGSQRAPLFADRGGVIQLQRVAPSGYGLLYPVLNGFAYLCFFSSCVCIVFLARKK